MNVQTDWVNPPEAINGQDHLAVQAPCINLYGRMLPGITNATDRARYYTFYPWVIWELEERGYLYGEKFIDRFRKADCLFTLIAGRHAFTVGGEHEIHAAATVGSDNLSKQLKAIRDGIPVKLSEYAHRDKDKPKYFKNPLGGLGQYYLGILREFKIVGGTYQSGIYNYKETAGPLVAAMNKSVNADLFFQTINDDSVTVSRLDELMAFCPCNLSSSPDEQKQLCDLFFVRDRFTADKKLADSFKARRRSLQTILSLADQLANVNRSLDLNHFRGCTYSGALPNCEEWELPERLQRNQTNWSMYQRNEILSVTMQGIFFVLLDAYQESGLLLQSIDDVCNWFMSTSEVEAFSSSLPLELTFKEAGTSATQWLPALNDWENPDHEIQLANKIQTLSLTKPQTVEIRSSILLASMKALIALAQREETALGYGNFSFEPKYLSWYTINLQDFAKHCRATWEEFTVAEWLLWLIQQWGINTHLKVALKKLKGQSQSTFRIRPSDRGFEVISAPPAVFTSPRFKQSLRILKDIGALTKNGDFWETSELGKKLLEVTDE